MCALLLCSMTHYDITMGDDVARDANCNITIGIDVPIPNHCDITISNHIAMCTSQSLMVLYEILIYNKNSIHNFISSIPLS